MRELCDLTGIRFGRLIALYVVTKSPTMWKCQCDCGNTKIVYAGNLKRGSTKSCGCLSGELTAKRNTKHGMVNSKEYLSWTCVKQRCYYPSNTNYRNYGGRGILMSEEYKEDFKSFLLEIGVYPEDGKRYTVDRIDNNLGYVKGNIRWAEDTTQARNRRKLSINTSGVNAVYWNWNRKTGQKLQSVAVWYEGRIRKTKTFSAKKYGLIPAFAMACKYREEKIAELNSQGYGYVKSHGK